MLNTNDGLVKWKMATVASGDKDDLFVCDNNWYKNGMGYCSDIGISWGKHFLAV